ncbi:MAG: hypothetical protein ACI9AH_001850 [Oceanospirillaceae bacterium]|jgi:hypothetical protein|tara:strand:+ start:1949 stop:2731 length:783 start_codon:yes stop_codon:yes gene_type:complete
MVMFPAIDEAQRLQYLQALGIASWLPIEPLIGSDANDVLWQEELVQASNSSSASDLLAPSTIVFSVQSLSVEADTAPSIVEVLPPMPVTVTHPDRLAPLHLGLSWYSNGVLVVNDIPVQEGAAMSSPIQRLQTAIVNALRSTLVDASAQAMPAVSMEFNWPLVPGPHADHSLMGAQSGLKYSLIKLLKDNSCSKLLIMGPAAIQLLKPGMTLGESAHIELPNMVIEAVYSHSLHQLLAVPTLKADTWQHLQSLFNAPKTV